MPSKNMMIYALTNNYVLKHVEDVDRGKKCNCFCPACNEPLIARKGEKNQHSFAHIDKEKKCLYWQQTTLHYLAKEIFHRGCKITLPPVMLDNVEYTIENQATKYFRENNFAIVKPQVIYPDPSSVKLEKKLDDIIPDVFLTYNGVPLIIEIYVSHPVDKEKAEKIRKLGISAIEFDLSHVNREIDDNYLKQIIEKGINCKWIYYNISESKIQEIITGKYRQFELSKKTTAEALKKNQNTLKNTSIITDSSYTSKLTKEENLRRHGGNRAPYQIICDSFGNKHIHKPPCEYIDKVGC